MRTEAAWGRLRPGYYKHDGSASVLDRMLEANAIEEWIQRTCVTSQLNLRARRCEVPGRCLDSHRGSQGDHASDQQNGESEQHCKPGGTRGRSGQVWPETEIGALSFREAVQRDSRDDPAAR